MMLIISRDVRPVAVMLLAVTFGAGCQTALPCAREEVSTSLACSAGVPLGPWVCPGETPLPSEVLLDDGVTETEAVSTALWNNAAYQTLLAELGVSRADLLNASLLTDPSLQIMFPAGSKLWEWTLQVPLEAFWLRPQRIRAAQSNLDQTVATLVQQGWDLVRDVRLAHADLVLAQDRAQLAADALRLRTEIADLAERRLDAGDISELEAMATRVEVLQSEALAGRIRLDVDVAEVRLQTLMGLAQQSRALQATGPTKPAPTDAPIDDLVATALASRSDARAAAIAVGAAQHRLQLARCQFMTFTGLVDANERAAGGFEYGPGALFTLPIFNANRGGIARAEAELDRAMRNAHAVREQIVREVTTAHAQTIQARLNLEMIQTRILPTVQTTVELATHNFEEGGASYFLVLQTASQFLDARTRELELRADLQKAFAELERSVGQRLPLLQTDGVPALLPPKPGSSQPVPESVPESEEPAPDAPAPSASVAPFRLGCRPVRLARAGHASQRAAETESRPNVRDAEFNTVSRESSSFSVSHISSDSRQSDADPSSRDRAGSRLRPARLRGGLGGAREAASGDGADAPARGAPRAGHADTQGR